MRDLDGSFSYLNAGKVIDFKTYKIPLFAWKISAGFPSPAENDIEDKIDLNTHLITQPAATFILRVTGDSMSGIGIFPNSL